MSKLLKEDPRARPGPIEVFYSYAPEDEALREQLDRHLAVMKRRGIIAAWHHRRLGAGREWRGLVHERLEAARVVLLLVSADFLASNYCWDIEMTRALARHDAGEALVIPILLRACAWEDAPFARLRPLPENTSPVTSWPNQDEAWSGIAAAIGAALEALGRGDSPDGPDESDDDSPGDDRRRRGRPGFLVRVVEPVTRPRALSAVWRTIVFGLLAAGAAAYFLAVRNADPTPPAVALAPPPATASTPMPLPALATASAQAARASPAASTPAAAAAAPPGNVEAPKPAPVGKAADGKARARAREDPPAKNLSGRGGDRRRSVKMSDRA
jgi:TIR domain